MLYYVFSGRDIQLLTVLEQMRAQMNRIEAKVNRIALDRTDTPAPHPDNVRLPLANTQDVDNLEAALGQCRRTILGMYVPKNAVQRGLAFHAMTWKLRTGVVLCHVLSLTMIECL